MVESRDVNLSHKFHSSNLWSESPVDYSSQAIGKDLKKKKIKT